MASAYDVNVRRNISTSGANECVCVCVGVFGCVWVCVCGGSRFPLSDYLSGPLCLLPYNRKCMNLDFLNVIVALNFERIFPKIVNGNLQQLLVITN